MIAMTMLPDILAEAVVRGCLGGVIGWFRMRLNLELRSFAVWEEAFDGCGDRNSVEARKPCGCRRW